MSYPLHSFPGNRRLRPASMLLTALAFTAACATAQAAPAAGARYVAMGSSYAAGPGVGTKDGSSGACARSMNNYARQVAAARQLNLVDVSCSGATTDNILSNSQAGFAPQIEAVTADTAMVSMTIGGNDVGYIGNLLGKSCHDEAAAAGNGEKKCSFSSNEEVVRRLGLLEGKITNVVNAIRQRAPKATIVLVNYLPVLPESGGCAGIPLDGGNSADLLRTYHNLVTVQKETAQKLKLVFIASAHLGLGHDACSATPYTTSYHPAKTPGWSGPVAYHPTLAGMTAVAEAIDRELGKH